MKNKMHKTTVKEDKNILHIFVNDSALRNEFHFDIQRNTRMNVYKDKTKYTRKIKHKNKIDD